MTATLPSIPIGSKLRGSQLGAILNAVSAITNVEGSWTASSAGGTTSSSAYANMPSPASFSFAKQEANSRLLVFLSWSARVATGVKQTNGAVLINGTDYQITHQEIPITGYHWPMTGLRLITGIPAGNYTIQGRFNSVDNATQITIDPNDGLSMICAEIPA